MSPLYLYNLFDYLKVTHKFIPNGWRVRACVLAGCFGIAMRDIALAVQGNVTTH